MKKFNYVALMEAVFYAFVSICFFRFLWILLIDIGSKHDGTSGFYLFPTIYPRYLLMAIHVYVLFIIHHIRHPHSAEGKKRTVLVNGLVLAGLSLFLLLACIVKMANGNAPLDSFYNLSLVFTLDCLVWAIIYIFFGGFMFLYARKYLPEEGETYEIKEGLVALRVLRSIGASVYVVFSLFYTGDALSLPLTFDHSFAHFGSMIPVYLLLLLFPASLVFYELVYKREDLDYVAKKRWQLLSSSILLGASMVIGVWIFIASKVDPDFLTEAGTSLFPIEHMLFGIPAVGPIICLLFVMVASIISILNYIKPEKKEEKE